MGKAQLTEVGKLVVSSEDLVEKLNAEMLSGKKKSSFLFSDEDSTLASGKTLTAEGDIKINGSLKVGSATISPTSTGISIGF